MKKKVIMLLHQLQHYRIPILNLVSEECELTIVCDNSDRIDMSKVNFSVLDVKLKNIGPFIVHDKSDFKELLNEFDVVISLLNIRCFDIMKLLFLKRNFKLALWGIGVTASYNKRFDERGLSGLIREFLAVKADALIFYSDYPTARYINFGYDMNKIYIANNTIDNVIEELPKSRRNSLLFVGTLYKEKGILELLDAYRSSTNYIERAKMPKLVIVGDGELKEEIISYLERNDLTELIELRGAIYDQKELNKCFAEAIASVSFNQAGLSVLTSMSNGVPFITSSNAITGGEILNIKNGENGILIDSISDLEKIICEIAQDPGYFINMGKRAHEYYLKNRKPEVMASGLIDCIKGI
ncbi:TPA: glycosyltransferase family 4 protein [Vibrio vulnificus]|nr:glycosyltransferase family 4 protein [Vibrio vulnificus]